MKTAALLALIFALYAVASELDYRDAVAMSEERNSQVVAR